MLENLRTARPGQMQQRGASQAQQMMRGMQELMQRQQQLLDRSFRAQRQQGQQGQQGRKQGQPPGQQPGQQPGGDQADSGQTGDLGDAAGQQEELRHALGEIMRQLGDGMGDIPEPFGRAERAMRDATGALQRSRPSEAIGPQTEALDQLQQAARDFAQQLQQRLGLGNMWGNRRRDRRDRPRCRATGSSATRSVGRYPIMAHSIRATSKSPTRTSCKNRDRFSMNCAAAPASVPARRSNSITSTGC